MPDGIKLNGAASNALIYSNLFTRKYSLLLGAKFVFITSNHRQTGVNGV